MILRSAIDSEKQYNALGIIRSFLYQISSQLTFGPCGPAMSEIGPGGPGGPSGPIAPCKR